MTVALMAETMVAKKVEMMDVEKVVERVVMTVEKKVDEKVC